MFSSSQYMIYRTFPGWFRALFALVSLFFVGLIGYESLIEVSAQPSIQHLDKLIHMVAYGALVWVTLPALSRISPIWICVGILIYGIAIEIAQGAMGIGRSADPYDVLANFTGISLALGSWVTLSKLTRQETIESET